MGIKYIHIVFLVSVFSFATLPPRINFAPLPMTKEAQNFKVFLSMTYYLDKKLGLDVEIIKTNNYEEIIKGFQKGTIGLAYLGPLPLAYLLKNYLFVAPLVTFKEHNKETHYRCVLAKFKKDTLDTTKPLKIALTQPLSTCGYYMTQKLLKQKFQIDIKEQYYQYTMSHCDALLQTLQGKYDMAGAKDAIAQKLTSLGMEIIATSEPLPGFSLVANTKTLSPSVIEAIRKTLLDTPQSVYGEWGGDISHGMQKATLEEYQKLDINFDAIPFKGNLP